MAAQAKNWLIALKGIQYRELLNTPGIARAHDLQRMVSYSLGLVVGLVLDLAPWRTAAILTITGVQLLATAERLFRRRKIAPYLLAQLDQLLSVLGVAAITGSPVITLAVVAAITAAIVASFAAPVSVATRLAVITSAPGLAAALVLGAPSDGNVAEDLAAFVLILLLIALAAFILGFFTIQARQLRSELTSRETQLDAVLEVTPVVLASVDGDGRVTTLAGDLPSWAEMSGTQVPPELGEAIANAGGRRVAAEVVLEGRTFTVICDPGSDGSTLLTAYDVTEQTEARQRLEELIRSKDQFIAAVSHELRTPLSSVLGFAEVVKAEMHAEDPLQVMVGEVADQSAEMAAIIDDLLVAARSSFEEVLTAPRVIDLAAEAAAVLDSIASRLTVEPECDMPDVQAYADPIRVRQIIRNLLTNADRYGGERTVVRTRNGGKGAILEVRDSGAALPADMRDRIFEPYESSGPVRGQPAAIGLGLAVSRTLAELMGGSLEYRHDGEWSAFELTLPARDVPQRADTDGSAEAQRPAAR